MLASRGCDKARRAFGKRSDEITITEINIKMKWMRYTDMRDVSVSANWLFLFDEGRWYMENTGDSKPLMSSMVMRYGIHLTKRETRCVIDFSSGA